MTTYTFSQARALLAADPMPIDKIWETIIRDITHLPQDARDALYEWKDMYEQYATGEGIQGTVKNAFKDAVSDILRELWYFVYDYGYWIALFGGLAAILLYICGHKGALKWVWTLVIGYVVICSLGAII